MPFNYTVTLADPGNRVAPVAASMVANVKAALETWGSFMTGQGSVDLVIQVGTTSTGRFSGGYVGGVNAGTSPDGRSLVEPGAIAELATGTDSNGAAFDLQINVEPGAYLDQIWWDPDPAHRTAPVPIGMTDGFSVAIHEIGHGLGMIGYRDTSVKGTWPLGGALETTFDNWIQSDGKGGLAFVGPNAEAVYGGPVPLTTTSATQDVYHLGNTLYSDAIAARGSVGIDGLLHDLMNGTVFYTGERYHVGPLDLAILRDLDGRIDIAIPAFANASGGVTVVSQAGFADTAQGGTSGRDSLVESGPRASYDVAQAGNGTVTLAQNGVTDTATGIERVVFGDGVLILDAGANSAPAFRLYQAAFARAPDEGGLLVQSHQGFDTIIAALVAQGHDNARPDAVFTLTEAQYSADVMLAQNFIGSAEFRTRYGASPSDSDFVALLYRNVLGRAPDAGGLAHQLDALAHGASRAVLLANFAESPEDVARTQVDIVGSAVFTSMIDPSLAAFQPAIG